MKACSGNIDIPWQNNFMADHMLDTQGSFIHRYPELESVIRHIRRNPQLWLSGLLFAGGAAAAADKVATLAGALFAGGATLLGAWITEQNNRRSAAEERSQRQEEARQYLAPELQRTIERVLYIHERAIPNFISASAENEMKPNDLKEDFIPYWPALYPNTPKLQDLSGVDAAALGTFYDSLHFLDKFVSDWWEREGQLRVNFFNMVLHHADKSLGLALDCIEKFQLERLFPPPYESWGTLSSRIQRTRSFAADARQHHIKRSEAKTNGKVSSLPLKPRRA